MCIRDRAETTAVTTETAAERDLTQDLPQARAVVSAAKTTHAFQLNGKAVTNPVSYTHLDVYKRQAHKQLTERRVRNDDTGQQHADRADHRAKLRKRCV